MDIAFVTADLALAGVVALLGAYEYKQPGIIKQAVKDLLGKLKRKNRYRGRHWSNQVVLVSRDCWSVAAVRARAWDRRIQAAGGMRARSRFITT